MVSAGLGGVKAEAPDGGGAPAPPAGFLRDATGLDLHLTAMGHLGRVPPFSSFTARYEGPPATELKRSKARPAELHGE